MRKPAPVTVDRVLAAVLCCAVVLEAWLTGAAEGHRVAATLLYVPAAAALAVRRRFPVLAGAVAVFAGDVGQGFWPTQLTSGAVAWMCDIYALAVWTPLVPFAVLAVAQFVGAQIPRPTKAGFFFVSIATIVMVLVRSAVRNRDRRASLAERERDVAAREAVVEERARIARELHDVIAHHVSMIVLQAGAERRSAEGETAEVLETIERSGRDALTETRRLLGMLREDTPDPLSPQPCLADLPTLVRQVREAGLPVDLRVDGEERPLPVGLELSAYRIVQEALTNALKHAGDASACVRVHYGTDELELEVEDDGPGAPSAGGAGHGLVGMSERVALYGGRLEATKRRGGGFLVKALLPIR